MSRSLAFLARRAEGRTRYNIAIINKHSIKFNSIQSIINQHSQDPVLLLILLLKATFILSSTASLPIQPWIVQGNCEQCSGQLCSTIMQEDAGSPLNADTAPGGGGADVPGEAGWKPIRWECRRCPQGLLLLAYHSYFALLEPCIGRYRVPCRPGTVKG